MNCNNCCCCCFTVKTGVLLIGILSWIGLVLQFLELGTLITLSQISNDPFYSWWEIARILILLIVCIKFCKVRSSLGTQHDFVARKSFSCFYLVMVIVDLACDLGSVKSVQRQIDNLCERYSETPDQACDDVEKIYAIMVWPSLIFHILIKLYFYHICRLYARQITPRSQVGVNQSPQHSTAGSDNGYNG